MQCSRSALRRIDQKPALNHAERVETSLTIRNRAAFSLPGNSKRLLRSGRNDKLHTALRILGTLCVARHKALPICHVDRSGDISHY